MNPTAAVIHGAGERRYFIRRSSASAAIARPASRITDQYLPSIAAAALFFALRERLEEPARAYAQAVTSG